MRARGAGALSTAARLPLLSRHPPKEPGARGRHEGRIPSLRGCCAAGPAGPLVSAACCSAFRFTRALQGGHRVNPTSRCCQVGAPTWAAPVACDVTLEHHAPKRLSCRGIGWQLQPCAKTGQLTHPPSGDHFSSLAFGLLGLGYGGLGPR